MSNNKNKKKNKRAKGDFNQNIVPFLIILSFMLIMSSIYLIAAFENIKVYESELSYNEFFDLVDQGKIDKIHVTKSSAIMEVYTTDDKEYRMLSPQNDTFIKDLMEKDIKIEMQGAKLIDTVLNTIGSLMSLLILSALFYFLSKQLVKFSFGEFKIISPKDINISFDDIKGLNETKSDIRFIVEQLNNRDKLEELGARPCKGALLFGPPGVGKTMIAKAIAKETNSSFISMSGADFVEMFAGLGASKVRTLWMVAKRNTPCIIFIDEIECLGRKRRSGGEVDTEYTQTLDALLQKMDGIDSFGDIFVLGATNRKEDLDEALLRPGRFDRQYYIGAPTTKKDREEITKVYMDNKLLDEDVTLESASKMMIGLTGAQIEEVLNESVYISLIEGDKGLIKLKYIDEAMMKIHTSGVKIEHASERDLHTTAVHEAGHTIASLLLGINIIKVSINAYSSGTGGVTIRDNEENESRLRFKSDYIKDIQILLAGKVAEEIVFGEHSQGCSNDIEKVTGLIYSMITELGFSNRHILNENILMNNGINHLIEKDIINECNKQLEEYNSITYKLLSENKKALEKLSNELYKNRTILSPTLEQYS